MSDIYLRALEPEDYKNSIAWRNDTRVADGVIGTPFYISDAMEKEWYAVNTKYDPKNIRLAICLKSNNKHIGNVYLTNIDYIARTAIEGIFIGEVEEWGKGYAYQACQQIISFGFNGLGLNKIYCHVLVDNLASVKLHEKLGFEKEGLLCQHVYKNGGYKNVYSFGLLKENWLQRRETLCLQEERSFNDHKRTF